MATFNHDNHGRFSSASTSKVSPNMHMIEITTVDPPTRVYTVPEHVLRTYENLETFVRNTYKRDARTSDLHVHCNSTCTGTNDIQDYSYEALVASDMHWWGLNGMPMRYYVCFPPKAQMLQTPTTNMVMSPLSEHPDVINNSLDHDTREVGTEPRAVGQPGLSVTTSLASAKDRRPSNDNPSGAGRPPKKQKSTLIQRLTRPLTAEDIGPRILATPMLAPLTASPYTRASNFPTPISNDDVLSQAGTSERPWVVSSRNPTPAPTGPLPRPDPLLSTKQRNPGDPVDPHKSLYEFLLSKKLPAKPAFIVGTLNREKAPPHVKLPPGDRVNVVTARLSKTRVRYALWYIAIDQDAQGRPMENPLGNRRLKTSAVDYFPEIQIQADHEYLRSFLTRYITQLLKEVPFHTAGIVDLTNGFDTDSDEDDEYEERYLTKTIILKLPKSILSQVEKAELGNVPLRLSSTGARLANNPSTNTGSEETPASTVVCDRCRENGDNCRPVVGADVSACHLCYIHKETCSLEVSDSQAERSLSHQLFSSEDDQRGHLSADEASLNTMVNLNITFKDQVDRQDYSAFVNFEKRQAVPRTEKPSDLIERLRAYIKTEADSKANITESHSMELNRADLVIRGSAPGAAEGAWVPRRERRPWIKSWEPTSMWINPLVDHESDSLDLTVEMYRHGSRGMPINRGISRFNSTGNS